MKRASNSIHYDLNVMVFQMDATYLYIHVSSLSFPFNWIHSWNESTQWTVYTFGLFVYIEDIVESVVCLCDTHKIEECDIIC